MKLNLLHRLCLVFFLFLGNVYAAEPIYKVVVDTDGGNFSDYTRVSKMTTQSIKEANFKQVYDQKIVWGLDKNKSYNEELEIQVIQDPKDPKKSVLKIKNLKPEDDVDWQQAEHVIDAPLGSDEWKTILDKHLMRFFAFYNNREEIKTRLLAEGLVRDKSFDLSDGVIKGVCGETLSFDEARQKFLDKSKRNKNYMRTMLEIFANLGVAALNYYTNMYKKNKEDFDLPYSLETQRKKWLFQEVAMDANSIGTNSPGHPIWGASMYISGRTNGLSSLESFITLTGALLIWENVAEFREKLSLNDIPFTTVASFAIGESMYQLSEFFLTSSDSGPSKILGYILNPSEAIQGLINGRKRPVYPHLDKNGFRKDIMYDLEVATGLSQAFNSGAPDANKAGVALEINTKLFNDGSGDVLGKTEKFKYLGDTFLTENNLRAVFGEEGLQDFKWFLKAAYLGMYKKDLSRDEDGNLEGHSFLVSASSTYSHQYRKGRKVGDLKFNDFMGVVNIIGPSAEFVYARNGVTLKATLDLHPSFAAVRSYAIDEYDKTRGDEQIKDVLEKQKYYYAYGITGNGKVNAEYKGAELGGSYTFHELRSIEGFDRFQDTIEDDFSLSDSESVKKVWLKYKPFKNNSLKLGLEFQQTDRSGTIKDTTVSDRENRINGNLIFHFGAL